MSGGSPNVTPVLGAGTWILFVLQQRAVQLDLSGLFWSHSQMMCQWKRCAIGVLLFWVGGKNGKEPALISIKPHLADTDSSAEHLLLEGMKIYLLSWMGEVQR